MAEDKDIIKDLFSSKLKDFEPEVPASVWGGLDQLLSQQPAPAEPSSSSSNLSSVKNSLIKTTLIIVGVAAAIVAGVLFIPNSGNITDEPGITVNEEPGKTVDTIAINPIPETIIEPAIAKLAIAHAKEIKEEPVKVTEQKEQPVKIPVQKEEPKKEEIKPLVKKDEPLLATDNTTERLQVPKKESRSNGFSLSASANSSLLAYNESGNGSKLLFSKYQRSETFDVALKKENKKSELQHRIPVSVGVRVSKGITSNLSLETGVVYTYLSSELSSNSAFEISENQYFHYLGIPLTLNYTFIELGKTKFYLSIGGMVQKDINGKYESNMDFSEKSNNIGDAALANIVYYSEPYYIRESIKQPNPQFSANAAIGVAYPIYKKLYLYGTIGGAYYFDAGNKYHTIYSDQKIQFDLNMGLKFDF
ncbi:MAG: PorT family protein [Prevotella sp.]|jgi:outer membrane biosynthesis protein TonB|nr:PorT family protein [Prevotella sp.]